MRVSRRRFLGYSATATAAASVGGVLTAASARAAEGDDTVKLRLPKRRRAWEGWGASLAWWAKIFGDRDDLADLFFTTKQVSFQGKTYPGLGFTIARYNAGASSHRPAGGQQMVESPNILRHRQIEGFWLNGDSRDPASPSWDWSVDANQRAMLSKARDRGVTQLELFSNSPMWWMLHNRNPSGAQDGKLDNLRPEHHHDHARYLATIAAYARDNWGIHFDSVSPFNEPAGDWWFSTRQQEGCHFDVASQEVVIGHLRAELNVRGLRSVKVAASDDAFYHHAIATWAALSRSTRQLVGRVNVHGYFSKGRPTAEEQAEDRAELYQRMVHDQMKLWDTEYGDSDSSGIKLARNLSLELGQLRPTAWCYWQPLDGTSWGLVDADCERGKLGPVLTKFHVLAHYTRHIRPGARIFDGVDDHTVAAYDPAAAKLVIVVMNGDASRRVTYELPRWWSVGGRRPVLRHWSTDTADGGERYVRRPDTELAGNRLTVTAEPKTVQTFEIGNVAI